MKKITFTLKTSIRSFLIFGISCFSLLGFSQNQNNFENQIYIPSEPGCIYHMDEYRGQKSIPRSQEVIAKMSGTNRLTPCTTMEVTYTGFTTPSETAFQFAVDIWAASIESPQTIRIDATFSALGDGLLGSAGPNGLISLNPSTAPGALPNVFYPLALAEKLANTNFNTTQPDIIASFSNEVNWYFGLDANPPAGQFDFVSVVLHELGHGLGFIGFADVEGATGSIRRGTALFPSIYDNFTENGSGVALLTFDDPSIALATEFTSGDLFCNGPISQGQLGGTLPQLWAPSTFSGSSSYSHWDENVFSAGDINSLMSPLLAPGEGIHDPGPITLGFFKDMGWSICGDALTVEDFDLASVDISPNPFTSSMTIKLANSFDSDYNIELIDINGRVILSERKSARNNTVTLSNLDQLDDALYFVKITNVNTGLSLTKKVIKN